MISQIWADKDELNFAPSELVLKALKTTNLKVLSRYEKTPKLLEKLSNHHNISPEDIFLEQGIIGIIHRVFDKILTRESRVLLPELGYPQYKVIAESCGATVETFSFEDMDSTFCYDLKNLKCKMKQKLDVLVLIDPESPLGFSTSTGDLEDILTSVSRDSLVILDQAHEGFRESEVKDVESLVHRFPNLLIARGFSKFYGLAGARIAYALCGEEVKRMIHFQERYLGFDSLAQIVASSALDSKPHYDVQAEKIRKQKVIFNSAIAQLSDYRILRTDSLSCVVEVPEEQCEFLLRQTNATGIHIRHLGDYHEKLKNFYRVTMCPQEQIERIIDCFASVSWLHDLRIRGIDVKSILNTRDASYTVNKKEIPCSKTGMILGFHRVIVPPGKEVPPHKHLEQDEIFEFVSPANFQLNEESFLVRPGDLVYVKPGEVHAIKALPDKFARFTVQRFPYSIKDKFSVEGGQVIHDESNTKEH